MFLAPSPNFAPITHQVPTGVCLSCNGYGITGHTFAFGEIDEITCTVCKGTGKPRSEWQSVVVTNFA